MSLVYFFCEDCGEIRPSKFKMAVYDKEHPLGYECKTCGSGHITCEMPAQRPDSTYSDLHSYLSNEGDFAE